MLDMTSTSTHPAEVPTDLQLFLMRTLDIMDMVIEIQGYDKKWIIVY